MIDEVLSQPFFVRVLAAGLLASIPAGVIGTLIVVKKMSSITGGLAHAAFGGVGLAHLLGFYPLYGAAGFGILSGLGVAAAHRKRVSLDTAISMVWSVGMALGILFISMAPGYAPDLTTYLFGSILFASWDYVLLVALLDVIIVVTVVLLYDVFVALSFDEEFAEIVGVRVGLLWVVLMTLVALSVVALIRVVGVIMAIALLTVPAATARHWVGSLAGMMAVGSALAAAGTLCGILGSYFLSEALALSVPTGPLIVVIIAGLYGVSHLAHRWMAWRRR